jgi:glycosyltransferase involved in cell wall biosynthesis
MATYLRDAGWRVTWWTSGFDHFRKTPFTTAERSTAAGIGVDIEWLDGVSYKRNVSFARMWNHRQIARVFSRRAPTLAPPDAIALAFPPIELADAVSRYAVERHIPLLVDVRDLWPDVFALAAPIFARPLARVLFRPAEITTRRTLRRADAIVGVSDAYLDWGLRHASRARGTYDRVIPIFGPPLRDRSATPSLIPGLDPRKNIFAFIGSFGRSYDLHTVIEAATLLSSDVRDCVQIVLAGDGETGAALQRRAAGLPHVLLPGWLGQDETTGLMSVASAGLAAYARGALQSLPNKIVDYFSFGLPIVNALEGECAALLAQTGAGWNYSPGDSAGLAALISELAGNPPAIKSAAVRAREVFLADFEPERSRRSYADLLAAVSSKRNPVGSSSPP